VTVGGFPKNLCHHTFFIVKGGSNGLRPQHQVADPTAQPRPVKCQDLAGQPGAAASVEFGPEAQQMLLAMFRQLARDFGCVRQFLHYLKIPFA
jgi:hypothetical protein